MVFEMGILGIFLLLTPLPEPLITAPHQLFKKKNGTASLLPLFLPCKACGSKFYKNGPPTLNLDSPHWPKQHRRLRVFCQGGTARSFF
jgi:hypothetical protein